MKNEFLREEIKIKVLEILEDFTLNDEIKMKTNLSELELDDYTISEVILRLENDLDIQFDTDRIHSYSDFLDLNVKQLIDELFDLIY